MSDLQHKLEELLNEVNSASITDSAQLEEFRIRFLGSKNCLKPLFSELKTVPNEDKKMVGQKINELKNTAQSVFDQFQDQLSNETQNEEKIDFSRPGEPSEIGSRHPISVIRKEIISIFERIGYGVSEGPEVEDDWHNFSALNFPEEHPARDMQDTFFVKTDDEEMALRTHTSSVQVRVMENSKPPIRTISPGRVFRNEAISARAHCFFHQVEGLFIDKDVSFADLKQTILFFAQEMFGKKAKIRLRPSYFPFTEPSAEVDVSCTICNQEGCNVCKYTGWLEILGCGMVDPSVLEAANIDPKEYSGFAFGMGIERIAQLKYRVNDLRLYSENDVRFLKQFKSTL
ncbi:phenylalanine--tRNA ligase subunit alpha [Brumimicrobium aurantiacum]|uniref:Phenylalanine--tRNA ligase alpha subunit n=1 Tax=Brumimicrobium aurantiacum TaxID=1737063 RepID=A0A3E1EX69_9FLAO|nr:phenylalanine--tRNA ligase subunit alpha [Brumimicrobium aurantiacum]RFC54155.1 phenylalanine--tRNA ligase subunit alpha [Brumimicrobium aurantiacum]